MKSKTRRSVHYVRRLVCGFASLMMVGLGQAEPVAGSMHDLSAGPKRARSGKGTNKPMIKAETEKGVCVFCHTPHTMGAASGSLWNRAESTVSYIPYKSSTAKAHPGQPTGASKLCLSCHDGTVALGMLRNKHKEVSFSRGVRRMPTGRSNLGTDLSDDHPISFVYDKALADANGQLFDPALLKEAVRLDKNGELQCTTCHNPHNNQNGKFLVVNNAASALCNTCHNKTYWATSIHRLSGKKWDGVATDPWPHTSEITVAANACESCHTPHAAGTKPRLLNFPREEDNCFSCHNGHVAAKDIQREFSKTSVHPVMQSLGVHDPYEEFEVNPVMRSPRHVECADCHNPHAVKAAPATVPFASGALAGVVGINAVGNPAKPLTMQYELCFRCHGDSTGRGPARVSRQFGQTNTRLEFSGRYASYHPIESPGKNTTVPSLITPLMTSSKIYCTDCHNNDQGAGTGGSGPRGPHGSAYIPLLERNLVLTDFSPESPDAYAMCYKCHSRASILNDESFKYHKKHIVDVQAACTTCHDAHAAENSKNLINFNTRYVSPSPTNQKLEYAGEGASTATCSLMCHGQDHVALATSTNSLSVLSGAKNRTMVTGKHSLKR